MSLSPKDSLLADAADVVRAAEQSGKTDEIISSKLKYARALFEARRKKRAMSVLLEIEESARVSKSKYYIEILIGLGVMNKKCGKYTEAINWFERAERRVTATSDPHRYANIVNNKANVYLRMGDLSSANYFYDRGLQSIHSDQQDFLHSVLSMNMSLVESFRMNFHAADAWAQKALWYSENTEAVDFVLKVKAIVAAAVAKLQLSDVEAAEFFVNRAVALSKASNNSYVQVIVTALRLRLAAGRNHREFGKHLIQQLDATQPDVLDSDTLPFLLKSKEIFYESIGDHESLMKTLNATLRIALDENEGLGIRSSAKKLLALYTAKGDTRMVAEMLDHQAYAQYKLLAFSHQHAIRQLQIVQDVAHTESAFDAEVQQESRLVTLQQELEQRKYDLENIQNRVQDELAHVTHDLKNPLSNLLLLSKLVLSSPENAVDEWKDFIKDAESSSVAIERLVSTLPEVIKTLQDERSNEIESDFDVVELVRRVVSEYTILAREKEISINVVAETSIMVYSVENVVELVLRNIVSNAVKYSRRNGTVRVEVSSSESMCMVRVIDSGRGFSLSDREKLFTSMQRLSSTPTGGEDSSGVGLTVAKRLADQCGVQFELESTSTQGSVFKVEVPVADT